MIDTEKERAECAFRSDGTKDQQPYRTWMDAVRDMKERKENHG